MPDDIKVTLNAVEYTGRPLALRELRHLRHCKVEEFDLDVIALWLGAKSTDPRVIDPEGFWAPPVEIAEAVKTILVRSGFTVGEAAAGSDSATSTSLGSTVA